MSNLIQAQVSGSGLLRAACFPPARPLIVPSVAPLPFALPLLPQPPTRPTTHAHPTCQLLDLVVLEHEALQQCVADLARHRLDVERILRHDLLLVLLQGVGDAVQDGHPVRGGQCLQLARGAAGLDGHVPSTLRTEERSSSVSHEHGSR